MRIKAELLEDIKVGGEVAGYMGGVVAVLGFISDNDYTYAIVAYENQPMFEVVISKLRYIA